MWERPGLFTLAIRLECSFVHDFNSITHIPQRLAFSMKFSGSSHICLKSAQLSESPEPEGLFHDTGAINHHLRMEKSVSGSLIIGCPHVYRNQAVGLSVLGIHGVDPHLKGLLFPIGKDCEDALSPRQQWWLKKSTIPSKSHMILTDP